MEPLVAQVGDRESELHPQAEGKLGRVLEPRAEMVPSTGCGAV